MALAKEKTVEYRKIQKIKELKNLMPEVSRYNFKIIENKWQNIWGKDKIFSTNINKKKPKFYCLEMFPYPSGKIHIDHVKIMQ